MLSKSDYIRELQQLIDDIRLHMRDYPELNMLIDGEESSDKMIAKTIKYVVDYFNAAPPLLSSQYDWYNFPGRSLLIDGVIAKLEQQVIRLDIRNYYPASDGQVGSPSRAKVQYLINEAARLWQEFTNQVTMLKTSINLQASCAGVAVASPEGMYVLEEYITGKMSTVNSVIP